MITVNGTRKSERAGGLDAGEVSQFTISPGQYDVNIHSASDLVAQIDSSAFSRGEWISSLRIGDVDVVEQFIVDALRDLHGDLDAVVQAMSEVGMFCSADAEDLRSMVTPHQNPRENEVDDSWRNWVPSR